MRADLLVGRVVARGAAGEEGAPRRRIARPGAGEGTADRHVVDRGVAVAHLVDGHREDALAGLEHALRLGEAPHERHTHHVRARRRLEARPHVGVGEEHVLFPRRIAELVAAVAGRRLHALRLLSAEGERPHQRPVEPDLQLVARAHAADVVHIVAVQADLQVVLAVDREVVPDADAAPGAERHVVAHPVVLHQQDRHLVGLGARPERRLPHRQAADLARRRQVPLHQGGRDRQDVRHVVEAVLVDVVGRQQRRHVDVERQQVADGVGVLGAVEAVERLGASRIGMRGRVAVDLVLEPAGQRVVGGGGGTRAAGRRHRPRPEFRDDLLPGLGVRSHLGQIEPVEGQAGGEEALVVAGDAVAPDGPLQQSRARFDGRRLRGLFGCPRRGRGYGWRGCEEPGRNQGRCGDYRQTPATDSHDGSFLPHPGRLRPTDTGATRRAPRRRGPAGSISVVSPNVGRGVNRGAASRASGVGVAVGSARDPSARSISTPRRNRVR